MTSDGVIGYLGKKLDVFFSAILNVVSSSFFLYLTMAWFVFQAIYMVFSTKFGIPPDEMYHFSFIQLFSENGFSPFLGPQTGYFELGETSRNPFILYHYLLSLPYHLFHASNYAVEILRSINVGLGVVSLYLTAHLGSLLKFPKIVTNLGIFMLANTLMFVFLSASINYDNLFVVLTLLSIFLTIKIIKKYSFKATLGLVMALLAGLLTKVSFLPIAVVLIFAVVIKFAKNPGELAWPKRELFVNSRFILLTILFVLLASVFASRYLYNLAVYKDYSPNCAKVLSIEQCRQSQIFVRNENFLSSPSPLPNKSNYSYLTDWLLLMQERTYGIFGHKLVKTRHIVLVGVQFFVLLSVIATIRYMRFNDKSINLLLLLIILYTAILVSRNHAAYERTGLFEFSVQGRYIFAILPMLYLLANNYIHKLLRTRVLLVAYIFMVIPIFSLAGLPAYIYTTDASWHNPKMGAINKQVKEILAKPFEN